MRTPKVSTRLAIILLPALAAFTGCESSDSGGSTHVTSNVYYGVGFYDPYYHGHYDYDHDHDVVVTPPSPGSPPGTRPPPNQGLHPSHPIARPPGESSRPPSASPRPAARPMPSIPSTPRAAPRGGGGRRR
jgi:hypothetical protein